LDLAEALSNRLTVPFERVRIQVEPGGNLLSRARQGRYEALEAKRDQYKCDAIVLAHHRDDVAETVLFRILRNGRFGSFDVMPELSSNGLFRPLLQVSRDQINKYSRNRKIYYADDPSNQNEHFDRVWLRNRVIPMFEERFPDIKDKLVGMCYEARSLVARNAARLEETPQDQ
jgi:tRNA(Ile)-lysidine synthase